MAHSAIRQAPWALVRSWGLSGPISYGLGRVAFRQHLTPKEKLISLTLCIATWCQSATAGGLARLRCGQARQPNRKAFERAPADSPTKQRAPIPRSSSIRATAWRYLKSATTTTCLRQRMPRLTDPYRRLVLRGLHGVPNGQLFPSPPGRRKETVSTTEYSSDVPPVPRA